ncbi:FecR family protein [Pseudomonas sp. NPDC090203]|jgi:transmembrane sensor|uniref:FecR family protein n=1 Tax=Pseudomonas TaxID=286 RepID=UPI0023647EEA|nr:FecR family protein [Pseudomonas putida]MDD1965012.1 FecR family protein [Pseudomonas putida]
MSISTRPVSSQVLDAAIAWQLCLDCGQGSDTDREEFAKWYAASEEHARAWLQLGMVDQRFVGTTGPARSALLRSRDGVGRQMRKLGRGVAGFAVALGLTLLAGERYLPVSYWLADQRTATGEQRTIRLSDNTLVRLNTHSALDVRFDDKQRRIILQEGEIFVETGSHDDPRPFIVETDEGQMRALGTKFLVKRRDDGTLLSVLQSAVAAHPQAAGNEMILHEGQQMLIQRHSLGPMLALDPGADAWTRGMLVVDNAALKDVIAELGRYRSGYLGVASDVADLRITGSFPLNDTDLALKALMPTLPVAIEQRTHWWVTVIASDVKQTHKL